MKRLKRICILALVLVIIHLLTYPVYAIEFVYTPLNYPGASSTVALGIDGSNIVGAYNDSKGVRHGFLFDGTKWSTLDYPGALTTVAYGISGSNIVGGYDDSKGVRHGFLFDGTKWSPLIYPGASWTSALGIDGSNIVGVYDDSKGVGHGFLFDGTKWSTLDYPGVVRTFPFGISGSNIVGVLEPTIGFYGFLFDGTNWSSLGYPGAAHTFAFGISGSNIVGYYFDSTMIDHGFLAIPKPEKVNDLVTFSPISGTYSFTSDASGCPGGFAGKYSFQARLACKATSPSLTGLIIEVEALSNGNLLLNAAGGPGGAGSWLSVPKQGGNADGTLGPGESVDIPFVLCLKERKGFSFFVDVLGIAQ